MDLMDRLAALAVFILFFATVMVSPAKICYAEPLYCSRCDSVANCTTITSDVVPLNLNSSTSFLEITYQGSMTELEPGMFDHLPQLVQLTIDCGQSINAIQPQTFAKLNLLSHLTLYNSLIVDLPSDLFHPANSLQSLSIGNSKLTDIPLQLLPNLSNLTNLNLEYNDIVHKDCSSIGTQFSQLEQLRFLNLANMTVDESCANGIWQDFFLPIAPNLQSLNLTMANKIWMHPTVFNIFQNLKELDISLAEKFSVCPSLAVDLFMNMPESLETLHMGRWRSEAEILPSCYMNETAIAGLKNLPNLTKLNMRFGDMLFGPKLSASIFSGFTSLQHLDIGWCRFSDIEDFAFDNCSSLKTLSLDGNPLGPRPIRLCSNSTVCSLHKLELSRATIYSDFDEKYTPNMMLRGTPVLEIDVRHNLLHKLPTFADPRYPEATANLQVILLGHNFLKNLYFSLNERLADHCHLLPNLSKLSLTTNRLRDIDGLCTSLTHLDLSSNFLNEDWDSVEKQLMILHNIEVLDLSKNDISNLTAKAFRSMPNLTELYLSGNNLTKLPSDLFQHNKNLEIIDLELNKLTEFKVSIIENLPKLKRLNLQYNMITYLEPVLTDFIQNSHTIVEFGILSNPLTCSCSQENVQQFIRATEKVPDSTSLTCAGPTRELRGQKVYEYERDTYYCEHRDNLIVAFSVLGGFALTLVFALPCYKYRWYLSHARIVFAAIKRQAGTVKFEHNCVYDAFVLYNNESEVDSSWIVDNLYLNTEEYSGSDLQVSWGPPEFCLC